MNKTIQPGDKVQHFKRQFVEEKDSTTYLYQVVAFAKDSETQKKVVVYKALYGTQELWVRDYEMFMSKVDQEKYPEIKQTHRFEKVE